jgi:hypothetical protein
VNVQKNACFTAKLGLCFGLELGVFLPSFGLNGNSQNEKIDKFHSVNESTDFFTFDSISAGPVGVTQRLGCMSA